MRSAVMPAAPSSGPELLAEVVEALQDAGSVRIEGTAAAPRLPVQLVLPADEDAMAYERVLRFGDFGQQRAVTRPANPITADELGG